MILGMEQLVDGKNAHSHWFSVEEKNKYLEELSKCSMCKKISNLYYCSSCYIKVCEKCYNIRERNVNSGNGDREIIIFCHTCLWYNITKYDNLNLCGWIPKYINII